MVEALVGALLGAAFGTTMAASATFLGFTASTMWVLGASLGSLFAAASFQVATVTPNYSLDPASNTLSGSVPVPVAYGRNRIAGNFFYQQFYNSDKKIMYIHCALSEGPIVTGGIAFDDIKLNDSSTATLTTVNKELFLGTSDQSAGTYDPEGLAYPNTAYISLRIEASAKVQGTPVITTVFQGRDIDYPGKGEAAELIDAEHATTAGYITISNTDLGYKLTSSTLDALGTAKYRLQTGERDNGQPIYDYKTVDLPSISWLSSTYISDKDNIICIPFGFVQEKVWSNWRQYVYRIRVYPDSTDSAVYRDFEISVPLDIEDHLTINGTDGFRMHWEIRRYRQPAEWSNYRYYSGVLYFLIPKAFVAASGKAKIEITRTYISETYNPDYTYPSLPAEYTRVIADNVAMAGLLNYSDILTDTPWAVWTIDTGLNNPAWCLFDFLTNTRYGAGIPEVLIDTDSFQAVADQCASEGITYNFVIDRQQPILDHIGEILTTFKGWMTVRDKISIGMDAPALAPSALITADDILVGSFSWWETPSDQVSNWITVEYIDGDGENDGGTWERVSVDAIDYDDADKRGIVQASYSLLAINNKAQAEAMASYLLNKSRYGQVFCQFTTMLNRSAIEVGDVIAITYDLPNWTEQWVRVVSIKDAEDGTIGIVCNVYDSRVYD